MKKIFLVLIVFTVVTLPAMAQQTWQEQHCLELHYQLISVTNQINALSNPRPNLNPVRSSQFENLLIPNSRLQGIRRINGPLLRTLEQRQTEILAELLRYDCFDIDLDLNTPLTPDNVFGR